MMQSREILAESDKSQYSVDDH